MTRAVVFAVLCLAIVVNSGEARTCDDISECITDLHGLLQQSDMDGACDALRSTHACFIDALDDCRQTRPELVSYVQPMMDELSHNVSAICSDSGAITTNPNMLITTLSALLTTTGHPQGMVCDLMACHPDQEKLTNEADACVEMPRVITCFEEFIANCGHQHPEIIGTLQQQVDHLRRMGNDHCGSGAIATTPHMLTTTLSNLLTTTGHPPGMVCDLMACTPDQEKLTNEEDACVEMPRVITCFEEFIANCGHQHPEIIDTLQQQVDQLRSMGNDHCGSGAIATTPHMLTTTLSNLLTTTGHPPGMVCDATACIPDQQKMTNVEEACVEMRRVVTCFDEFISNCGHQHPEIIGSLQRQVDQLRIMINDHCGSGAIATTPHMLTTTGHPQGGGCDPMACTPDQEKLTNEEEACVEMPRVITCFEEFIANCGHQHPEMIGTLQQQVDQLRSIANDHCGSGAISTTPHMLTTTLSNLLTTTGHPQVVSIANGKLRCSAAESVNGTLQCIEGQVDCEEGYEYSREDTSYRAGEECGECRQSIWGGAQANELRGLDNGFPVPRTPHAGWTVCLTATPTHFDRASLDFLGEEGRLFVSHFDMRMGEGMDWSFGETVVINEAEMGWDGEWDWADQDTYHPYPYPIRMGEQFVVRIVADGDRRLRYYVNDEQIASRYLQSSVSQVTNVVVQGTVDISQVDVWCQ